MCSVGLGLQAIHAQHFSAQSEQNGSHSLSLSLLVSAPAPKDTFSFAKGRIPTHYSIYRYTVAPNQKACSLLLASVGVVSLTRRQLLNSTFHRPLATRGVTLLYQSRWGLIAGPLTDSNMQKNHLIYFENSLSRPKSKSYSRLRLDRTAAGRASSRVKGQGQPSRSPDRDRGEPPSVDRLKEPPLSGEKEPSLVKTVETVVSSWLCTAVQRVALHSARAAPGPETATGTEATRRFSEPILPPPSPIPSTADNSRANKLQEMLDAIKDNFLAWKVPHLEHFEEEEKVMMPLVPQIAPSPLSRCRVVHREMISPAVDRSMGDFLFFIGWCTAKLNAHGSQQHPPAVAVRVFVRALQSTSSAAQWSVFGPVLQNNCSEEIWESMVAKYSVDRPFGDELLLGSADADFSGEPPTGTPFDIISIRPSLIVFATLQLFLL